MAHTIQEIMTTDVHCVRSDASLNEAARMMRDHQIGDVLVTGPDGALRGIITDRDIVVRAVAEARDLERTRVDEICSGDLVELDPSATIDDAVKLMRDRAIRRVPVVRDHKPVGIISIGDLARERDPESALADISAAAPNN